MSVMTRSKTVSPQSLLKKKQRGERITSITCYDYTTARLLDETSVDFLLVGDSLAMTVLGHANTLSITVDEMLHHVKAVQRGAKRAMIVADMPFMSYQVDFASSVRNAGRFVQEGQAAAVKLEGASELTLAVVRHITQIGIPVMGHLGFTPQSVNTLGGFKVQGKSIEAARQMLKDALALEAAGAFAVVLEMVPVEVASVISNRLSIPTIGIGSGNVCDGQVLVVDDVLGRYPDLSPRFVRTYLNSKQLVPEAIEAYCQDVMSGNFPNNEDESFHFDALQLDELHLAMMEV